jgi:membrane-associated phospholipid phosphatase
MTKVLAVFFGAFLTSLVALNVVGLRPVAPASLVVVLVLTVPFAYGVWLGASLLERAVRRRKHVAPLCGVVIGLVVLGAYQPEKLIFQVVDFLIFSALAARLVGGPRDGFASSLLMGLMALGLSQVAISWGNYVALATVAGRLHDPVVQAVDLHMYQVIYGQSVGYGGLFPLVSAGIPFAIFERAYIMLFPEIVVVLFALVQDPPAMRRYLVRMFACYLCGLGVFFLWPVVGPCLYYPESFRSGYEATTTGQWIRNSHLEFQAIRNHLQPTTGFGYFVAVPSLHTAIALLCQISLRRSRMLFWMFLPINALLIASTVVLGYHYAVDVVAGLGLTAIVLLFGVKRAGLGLPVAPVLETT